jgi:hypothetical protein
MFVLSSHGREIHEVVASLVPAGSQTPVPASSTLTGRNSAIDLPEKNWARVG